MYRHSEKGKTTEPGNFFGSLGFGNRRSFEHMKHREIIFKLFNGCEQPMHSSDSHKCVIQRVNL